MNAKELVAHMTTTFKVCECCEEVKALLHFYKQKDTPDGKMSWSRRCKKCVASKADDHYRGPVDPRGTEYIEVVVPKRQSKRWTAGDDAFLLANPHELTAVLAEQLRRTVYAVDSRRRFLRVR